MVVIELLRSKFFVRIGQTAVKRTTEWRGRMSSRVRAGAAADRPRGWDLVIGREVAAGLAESGEWMARSGADSNMGGGWSAVSWPWGVSSGGGGSGLGERR
jgi:hypothetical protein